MKELLNIKEYLSRKNWLSSFRKTPYAKRKIIENILILQTPFLPQNATIKQRGWHILNDVNCVPQCPVCNKILKFRKDNVYPKCCSVKCSANSLEVKSKRLEWILNTYGSMDNYRKYKAEVLKKSSLKKYGVSNYFQAEEVKLKIKNLYKN